MPNSVNMRSTRTLDRRIVHRAQVHEVFLTDIDEEGSRFLAQLPSAHAYFCDSTSTRRGLVDILTLMEACRQAATAAAHLFWGVPDNRQFVLTRWKGCFPVSTRPCYGIDPVDLRIDVILERPQYMREVLTGGRTRVTVHSLSGEESHIGTLELDVRYVSKDAYQFLRSAARGGEPLPTSITRTAERVAADPRDVGCTREDNVTIGRPALTVDGGHAPLRLPFHNRSMFDHAQDHAPAMVMVEAARQLVHATCPAAPAAHALLSEVNGDFGSYVELDASTLLAAVARTGQTSAEQTKVDVQVIQGSRIAASILLTFDSYSSTTNRKVARS